MDIFQSVRELVGTQFEIDEDKITAETTFDELGADSLDIVDVVSDIESEYEVEIADEEIWKVRTVGDIVKIFGEKI